MKTYLIGVVITVVTIATFGFGLPALFSAPSDVAGILGMLILLVLPVFYYYSIKALLNSIKNKNQKK